MLGKGGEGSIQWRNQRDIFIQCFTKLATGSQDNVPHTDTTFEELGYAVAEQISSGGYPETIQIDVEDQKLSAEGYQKKKQRTRKPRQQKDEEKPAEEEKPEEVQQMTAEEKAM